MDKLRSLKKSDFRIDKNIIRDLAKKIAGIISLPEQKNKAEMWIRHNRLERIKPMVLIFPEGSWRELIPEEDILTTDPFCRVVEYDLRQRLYYWEHLKDDNVIDGTVVSPIIVHTTGWGVDTNATNPEDPYGWSDDSSLQLACTQSDWVIRLTSNNQGSKYKLGDKW